MINYRDGDSSSFHTAYSHQPIGDTDYEEKGRSSSVLENETDDGADWFDLDVFGDDDDDDGSGPSFKVSSTSIQF